MFAYVEGPQPARACKQSKEEVGRRRQERYEQISVTCCFVSTFVVVASTQDDLSGFIVSRCTPCAAQVDVMCWAAFLWKEVQKQDDIRLMSSSCQPNVFLSNPATCIILIINLCVPVELVWYESWVP